MDNRTIYILEKGGEKYMKVRKLNTYYAQLKMPNNSNPLFLVVGWKNRLLLLLSFDALFNCIKQR